jgi:signal transduction protein with GAF and PtsI domain
MKSPENSRQIADTVLAHFRHGIPTKRSIRRMFSLLVEYVDFEAATLYLTKPGEQELIQVASLGKPVNPLGFLRFSKGEGLAGWVARQRRPVRFPGKDPLADSVSEHHDTYFMVPLLTGDRSIGMLCFGHKASDAFDHEQQKILETVAARFAEIIVAFIPSEDDLNDRIGGKHAIEALAGIHRLVEEVSSETLGPISVIIGHARIMALEAEQLPASIRKSIKLIEQAARQISLTTNKLKKIDRIAAMYSSGTESVDNTKDVQPSEVVRC